MGEGMDPDCVARVVLTLLLDPLSRGPWTAHELARELGDEVAAADAVSSLHASGLVHLCGELAFPSRAAARCFALADAT
jgi:hypothetical protein